MDKELTPHPLRINKRKRPLPVSRISEHDAHSIDPLMHPGF